MTKSKDTFTELRTEYIEDTPVEGTPIIEVTSDADNLSDDPISEPIQLTVEKKQPVADAMFSYDTATVWLSKAHMRRVKSYACIYIDSSVLLCSNPRLAVNLFMNSLKDGGEAYAPSDVIKFSIGYKGRIMNAD